MGSGQNHILELAGITIKRRTEPVGTGTDICIDWEPVGIRTEKRTRNELGPGHELERTVGITIERRTRKQLGPGQRDGLGTSWDHDRDTNYKLDEIR